MNGKRQADDRGCSCDRPEADWAGLAVLRLRPQGFRSEQAMTPDSCTKAGRYWVGSGEGP